MSILDITAHCRGSGTPPKYVRPAGDRFEISEAGDSCRNLVQSQFWGALDGAVDLIVEPGCTDNMILVVPGMTIVDQGVNTRYIGAEWAGRIERRNL